MQNDRLTLTVVETAKQLGLGRNQVYEAIDRGDIPSIRIGRRILVPARGIDRMLDRACKVAERDTVAAEQRA